MRATARLIALPALAVALLLAACGSSGDSGPDVTPSASGAPVSTLPSLTFTPDSGARATSTVTAASGGTVTATAADGTRFTLEVPPGAVDRTMDLSLTPLTGISGITDARATMGVEMGPDGTSFAVPLRLTISPATPIDVSDQFLFTSQGDGAGVQAATVDAATRDAVALIMHFSTAGLADLPSSADASVLRSQADAANADLAGRIAAATQIARRAQMGGDSTTGVDLTPFIDEYRTSVVEPRLAAASSSCDAAKEAIAAVTQYDRLRQLPGITPTPMMPLDELQSLDQGACEREAIARCTEAKDPGILVAFWLGQDRMRQLIGQDAGHDMSTIEADARRVCEPVAGFAVDPEDGGAFSSSSGAGELGAPGGVYGDVCDPLKPFTLENGSGGTATFTPDSTGTAGTMEWTTRNPIVDESGTGTYTVTWDGTSGHLHLEAKGHFQWIASGSVKPSGDVRGTAEFALNPIVNGTCGG